MGDRPAPDLGEEGVAVEDSDLGRADGYREHEARAIRRRVADLDGKGMNWLRYHDRYDDEQPPHGCCAS